MSEPFLRLTKIMSQLRSPGGCPWDFEQTHESLIPYLIEETYEVIEAIKDNDKNLLREELGDLILQVVFHAQIASDEGHFNIDDVLKDISDKLVRRHPHVFSNVNVENAEEVLKNWEEIKSKEKNKKDLNSILDSIPKSLPALFESFKLTKKASKVGFDWNKAEDVLDKIIEEAHELKSALKNKNKKEISHEMGDTFFALVNFCRLLNIQPEIAVKEVNDRFRKRFLKMEEFIKSKKIKMKTLTTDEWEKLWNQAKKETS